MMYSIRSKTFKTLGEAVDYAAHERAVSKLAGTEYEPSIIRRDDYAYGQVEMDGVFRTFERALPENA